MKLVADTGKHDRWFMRAFDKAKQRLGKKAVLVSTLAALSGGCGGVSPATGPFGQEGGGQGRPAPSLPSLDSNGLAKVGHAAFSLQPVPVEETAFKCDQSNETKFKSVELWGERYDGAEISAGMCARIGGASRTHMVFLDEERSAGLMRMEYSLLVSDGTAAPRPVLLTVGKYLRLGADATIYMLRDKGREISYMLLHRQARATDVSMEFDNFKATNTSDSCAGFIKSTSALPPVFEKVTGVNIGECYRKVRYRYNPDYGVGGAMANMDNIGNVAWVDVGPSYLVSGGICGRKYESHELQHAVRFCINSCLADEHGHIFWNATEAEVLRAFGDASGADSALYFLKQWVDGITKDPSPVMNASPNVRCTALKTFFLSKEYLGLSNEGRKDLVRAFHAALLSDPRMLAESTEKEAINEIACSLVSDPDCASTLKKNCP